MPIDPRMVKWDDAPSVAGIDPSMVKWDTATQQEQGEPDGVGASANAIAGLVRGAGSIGATILAPYDMARAALDGKGLTLDYSRDRRHAMDMALSGMGADPASASYGAGKLVGEIAGTAGVPAALGKGVVAMGAAPTSRVATAITSGGMKIGTAPANTVLGKSGDLGVRILGGGLAGGSAAGLVDPDQAASGAAIGASGYPVIKGAVMAGKAARDLVGTTVANVLGATTGAGAEAVKSAFNAGKSNSRAFLDSLAGRTNMTDVIAHAKAALTKMRADRSAEYSANMAGVSADKTVLDMAPIVAAAKNASSGVKYKGQVVRKNAADTIDEISAKVDEWAKLNPAEYHTPEGLDALKQAVGDIWEKTLPGTSARRAADAVRHAIKGEIRKQAPEYDKAMRAYSEASDLLDELTRTFSLGEKSSKDTAMRKLQSIMRNNVSTNFGNRLSLMRELETKGGVNLAPELAGQSMSSWMPRGLALPAELGAGAVASALNPSAIGGMMAAAPFASPRMMGLASYGAGRIAGAPAMALDSAPLQGLLANFQQGGLPPASLLATIPAVSLSR